MNIPVFFLLLLRHPASRIARRDSSLYTAVGNSITQRLHDSLLATDGQETIRFEGYVCAKRSFGSALAFVDLVSHPELDVCQALLRKEFYEGSRYHGCRKSILPGALVSLEGKAVPTRNPGEAVLLIQNMRLLELPRQPQHIRAILSLAAAGELSMQEVAKASFLSEEALKKSFSHQLDNDQPPHALAKSILLAMPPLPEDLQQMIGKKRSSSPQRLVQPPQEASMDVFSVIETVSVQEAFQLSTPVAISTIGLVQNRRRFDDKITVVSLVDEFKPMSTNTTEVDAIGMQRLECILHPGVFDNAETYGQLLTNGFRVWMSGILVDSPRVGQASTLWVKEARLVRASWRPLTLRYLLDVLYEGTLSVEEAADALLISVAEAEVLSDMDDLTARQWEANRLSVKLQSIESRSAALSPEIVNVLCQHSDRRARWPLQPPPIPLVESNTMLQSGLPGSRWQRKKRPQLEWMVHEIAQVARSHTDFGKRTLHILDVGGGKGKLANYLAQSLGDHVQVHVVDIAHGAIHNGAMRAKRLNLSVQYQVADASRTQFLDQRMDIVVALHACGHLSDVALAHAVQHEAGFVICPCCFLSNPTLNIPGTGEKVEDFLDIPSSEWWALKYLAEVQGDAKLSSEAIHTICAVRADAVSRKSSNCLVDIKSFPIQYSTRNICLVGRVVDV